MPIKLLTAKQMSEADRVSIEQLGIPGRVLMENAGRDVVETLARRFPALGRERIGVVCGKGNNGGDGFVVARHLLMRGIRPRVVLLADPTELQGDARANYELLLKWGLQPFVARNELEWAAARIEILPVTLLIDALLGTGLDRPVAGFFAKIIADITTTLAHAKIVAVDMPSGMPSDTGAPLGPALKACCTVTFTAPKPSQIFPPNSENVGELVIVSIGTPPSAYSKETANFLNLLCPEDVAPFLAPRPADSHKGSYGHVLVVGGSRGKSGAAAMTGMAGLSALRAGAGLVTVATAQSAQSDVAAASPALMTEALPESSEGSISPQAFDRGRFAAVARAKAVIAIGPGISAHPQTAEFVRKVVQEFSSTPMVIDADGLNAFAGAPELLDGKGRTLVLTPHPGEMARLTGLSVSEIQLRRVDVARDFAMKHHVYLVLKGYRTLIAEPTGQVYVNPTGNPGMSTAGTGDVLTGMIAALLGQHPDVSVEKVVSAAVYWHGAAGDGAAARKGELSLIATDLIDALPEAAEMIRGQIE